MALTAEGTTLAPGGDVAVGVGTLFNGSYSAQGKDDE